MLTHLSKTATWVSTRKPRFTLKEQVQKYKAYLKRRLIRVIKRVGWMKRKNAKRLKKTKKSRNARGYYVTNKYNKSVLPLFVIKVTPYSLTKFSMSNTLGIKSRSNLTIANFSMKSTHSCHTSGAVTSAKSILSKYNLTDSSCPAFEFFKTTNTRTRILQLTLSKLVLSKINNTKV